MTGPALSATEDVEISRPDELLDEVAAMAWQAYNAMETTKRRHFELLEVLDNKKKNYNIDPTTQDRKLIDCLLRDHDQQVKRFTQASIQLKGADASAHLALFEYIGMINRVADERQQTH